MKRQRRNTTERALTYGMAALVAAALAHSTAAQKDPWPHWGRSESRIANTSTIGPQTTAIDWSVLFSHSGSDTIREASPVMDAKGRIFVGSAEGATAIDSQTRSILWEARPGRTTRGVALWNGRVIWGDGPPSSTLHCYDAPTGQPIWTFFNEGSGFRAPVTSETGVVYVTDGGPDLVRAFAIDTGAELWSEQVGDKGVYSSPSLDWPTVVISSGGPLGFHVVAQTPASGAIVWMCATGREVMGTAPISGAHVYAGSEDGFLYCINQSTGGEIWRFWCENINRGAVAVGHNEAVYTGTTGSNGRVFAVSRQGDELWRFAAQGVIANAPIVSGDETLYFVSRTSSPRRGWLQAVNPDGTELWTIKMPDMCSASPMLAPDGTLYIVCRDKNLYAFRDPHVRATMTNLQTTTGEILNGGIEELGEVDDSYLHTRSGFGERLSDLHKMELIVSARVSDSQPQIMRIQIKSKIDHPSGTARVSLRNWQTGQLETVREYAIGLDDPFEWIQIPEGGNAPFVDPQRYIRPTGAIEMQLKHTVFVPFLAFTFESFIDQVKIEVTG